MLFPKVLCKLTGKVNSQLKPNFNAVETGKKVSFTRGKWALDHQADTARARLIETGLASAS